MAIEEQISARELVKLYAEGRRNFRNVQLSGRELKQVNLQDADLEGAYFRWADLRVANFQGANLSRADFHRANLCDASLLHATLKEANLKGANLQWADLSEANLQGASLMKSQLACANLRGASVRLGKLQEANLDRADLTQVDLRVASLQSAHLCDAEISQSKLQEAILSEANLTGANLEGASLQGANLDRAILVSANLTDACLQQVSLQGANLADAKLFGVSLEGANLHNATLPAIANLQGACLRGAKLQGVRLSTGENLLAAMLPNGMIPDNRHPSPAIASSGGESENSSPPPTDSARNSGAVPTKEEAIPTSDRNANSSRSRISGNSYSAKTFGSSLGLDPDGAIANGKMPNPFAFPPDEALSPDEISLEFAQQVLETEEHLNPASLAIAHRRGSSSFRHNLLAAYNGRCAITGCNAEPVLEAVTLCYNHDETHASDPSAGLLLRADIHTLFDLHLMAIHPETLNVWVSPSLQNTDYRELHGQPLRPPVEFEYQPRRELLQLHWRACAWVEDCEMNR